MRRQLFTAALIVAVATAALAQSGFEDERLPALSTLAAHIEAGDLDAAESVLRDYLDDHACDGTMHYNLACILSRQDRLDEAMASLDRALVLGYRDLERVRTDPDLAALALETRLTAHRDTLLARRDRASRALDEDQWGEWIDMVAVDPACGEVPPVTRVRFRYTTESLRVETKRPDEKIETWQLVVSIPPGPDSFEADRTWTFAATRDGKFQRTRRNGRAATGPVRKLSGGDHDLRLEIPWEDLESLGPPLDTEIGINLIVDGAALVPDPLAGSWRRYVVLAFIPGERPHPAVRGRLATTVLVGDTLSMNLAEQGLAAGSARLDFNVYASWDDRDRERVVSETRDVRLEPDLAFLDAELALDELASPFYRLTVQLRDRESRSVEWSTRGVRLPPDWFVRMQERLTAVPEAERSIADRWLFFVLRELEAFDPREDPRKVARPVAMAETLLTRAEQRGTVLTPGSRLDVAFPVREETYHPAALHLPEHFRPGSVTEGLVLFAGSAATVITDEGVRILPPTADENDPFRSPETESAWRWREDDRRVVLVVANPPRPADPDYPRQVVFAAATWLAALCGESNVEIAAWQQAGGPVLEAIVALPVPVSAVRLLPDGTLDPWPGAEPDEVAPELPHATPDSPTFTFVYDEDSNPKLKALSTVLWRQGYLVQTKQAGTDAARDARLLRDGR